MASGGQAGVGKELESDIRDMDIKDEIRVARPLQDIPAAQPQHDISGSGRDGRPTPLRKISRVSESPRVSSPRVQSPAIKPEKEAVVGGDIILKMEPGEAPKLSRKASHKVPARPPPLFSHLPDSTLDAKSKFEVMDHCSYAAKWMGYSEPPLECDCSEEWDAATQTNHACGEDSDCINRATKMECDPDCGCGAHCQNQRFQRSQFADVSVIKTDKKGYGLRANVDLKPNDFIFEYIGEVIGEAAFRRRMHQYDEEGIKHFYFMSLGKSEFVDATKKGNLGRFCNHSCNPNCYVDKWVVGEKLRMGIFAERAVKAGEELVFNYNVDRYGADPQPCYCGEPNCVGFIGGKTQTNDRSTQLSRPIREALGLEDADDWDAAVSKKPRKRKTAEDDEEYVNDVQPKGLDMNSAVNVLAVISVTQEKWIAAKTLERLQSCTDEVIQLRLIRAHGYRLLNMCLKHFPDDVNICLQVCDICARFPKLTRNKIAASGIEETMTKLAESEDDRLRTQAKSLLDVWSKLEVGFRIQKIKRDPATLVEEKRVDRRDLARERARSRSRSRSIEAPKGPAAPTGPRNSQPQRAPRPPPFRPRGGALPEGWFQAANANGTTYYYNALGATTWQRPTLPSITAPPPPPPKAVSDREALQSLIDNIVQKKKETPSQTPGHATPIDETNGLAKSSSTKEKWRSWPEEKRKKAYENTIAPIVSEVMHKYKNQLKKEDLKKLAKYIAKKVVESDFKHGRVDDPYAKIDRKRTDRMKTYIKAYFDKAVSDKPGSEKKSASRDTKEGDDINLSDVEEDTSRPSTTPGDGDLKRRREAEQDANGDESLKKARTGETSDTPPPPPPPPPPPMENPNGVLETGLNTNEDISGSFHEEAIEAVTNGHARPGANDDAMEIDGRALVDVSGKATALGADHMQVATPPTTGSPYPTFDQQNHHQ